MKNQEEEKEHEEKKSKSQHNTLNKLKIGTNNFKCDFTEKRLWVVHVP